MNHWSARLSPRCSLLTPTCCGKNSSCTAKQVQQLRAAWKTSIWGSVGSYSRALLVNALVASNSPLSKTSPKKLACRNEAPRRIGERVSRKSANRVRLVPHDGCQPAHLCSHHEGGYFPICLPSPLEFTHATALQPRLAGLAVVPKAGGGDGDGECLRSTGTRAPSA